ncbi:MAG: hypothetical protein QOG43_2938 [Actinomycetota bacterium]|nr:hypothetical protein [Actinomycetota bacterium]
MIGDTLILADFPNPVGWAIDKVAGFVGGAAAQGFEMIIGGLTAWMLDAVVWVVGGVFNFFLDATDPNVQADWFLHGTGPYATTVGIGAVLLVGFVLIGITQGVLAGDVAGMLRRVAFELPMAVVGMVGLVTVTQALVTLTDQLSKGLLDHFGEDVQAFTSAVGSLASLTGGTATAFVVFLLALISVLAGIVLVAEMVVRASLIYIVVALAPLIFAAQLWPALRGAGRKLLELLVALIVSKLVVAVALAVAAAAAVGVGSGGEVTSLPPPEVMAQNPGGSVTQAVGILLTAAAAFGVAAFSPLLVARLLPLTEAAVVASGIRGGPVRAGQQALSARYYTQIGGRSRLTSLAASQPGGGGGGPATAGAGAGAAAGAGVAAAGAVAGAARTGARATTSTAESASSPAPTAGGSPEPRPSTRPTPRRPPTEPGGDDDRRS